MMKRHRLFTALLSALLLFTSALISCGKEDTAENETTLAETEEAVSNIVIAKRGEDTQFRLAYNVESEESVRDNILEDKKGVLGQARREADAARRLRPVKRMRL